MNALTTYALKKRYVEGFIAKAMRPDPLFVWTDTREEMNEHGEKFTRHVSLNYDEAENDAIWQVCQAGGNSECWLGGKNTLDSPKTQRRSHRQPGGKI